MTFHEYLKGNGPGGSSGNGPGGVPHCPQTMPNASTISVSVLSLYLVGPKLKYKYN